MSAKRIAARALLAALRLPRLPYVTPGAPERERYARAWEERDTPSGPLAAYLRWLATTRPVVFHGSKTAELTELSTERRSRDATEYGDRRAVYASQDPVWSLFYAVLDRGPALNAMTSASLGADAAALDRRYLFSVDREPTSAPLLTPGWLYVLPAAGFEAEPPLFGLLDTAHRTNRDPVAPLACWPVQPGDFPFAARIGTHVGPDTPWRAIRRASKWRRSPGRAG